MHQMQFQPDASNAPSNTNIYLIPTLEMIYCAWNPPESTGIHPELPEFLDSYSFIWSSSTFYQNPPRLLGIHPEIQESRESDQNRWGTVKHWSPSKILETLKPGMMTLEIVCCFDDHFWWVIYSLGPYIADYPEQALLTCIVQGWCPQYNVFWYIFTIAYLINFIDVLRSKMISMEGVDSALMSIWNCWWASLS